MATPKFLENIAILCFERRFSKQNSVIRLESNILASPNFWAGYAIDGTYTAGVRRTRNQTDSADVTCSRSCDQRNITKRLKDNQGWENPFF